jgi:SPP1 family predicted phage head-tail adaptor
MELDRKISIQKATFTTNAAGQPVTGWVTLYADIHGAIVTDSATEKELAYQMNEVTRARWIMRNLPGVDHTCRLQWNGQNFQIEGVTHYRMKKTERPRYWLLQTFAQDPDQNG